MTLELRKIQLIEMILAIRDEQQLAAYEKLAKKERIAAYEATLKPMTLAEYEQRILKAEEDVKSGNMISIEDLEKEMETW